MRKARKYALDILYSADLTGGSVESAMTAYATMSDHPLPDYARRLAEGVAHNEYLIDGYLAPCLAADWTVERMPVVDRCLARIAVYEMVYADLPAAIAISEAASLAAELSTDSSPAFLTGVLGHVASLVVPAETDQSGQADPEPDEGLDLVAATVDGQAAGQTVEAEPETGPVGQAMVEAG